MPRLSIIVPHRHDDLRLEATLLSLLENRPADSEIIVAHNGSYADPYQLQDEVIFIEEEPNSNTAQLLNAGVMAACSSAICVLLDGSIVADDWSEAPLATLFKSETAAVAVTTHSLDNRSAHGIAARLIRQPSFAQSGRITARSGEPCIGPTLACGFYRRKVLLALGGWNPDLDEQIADVDFALALHSLGLSCLCDPSTSIAFNAPLARNPSATATKQLASLFAAYGLVSPGWSNSFKSWLSGCVQGRPLAASAWAAGLRDASTIRRTQLRMNHARQRFAGDPTQQSLRVFQGGAQATSHARRQAA